MVDQNVASKYPPLSSSNFDRKKFQKELKQTFEKVKNLSRFGITGKGKEFDKNSRDIIDRLRTIMLVENTYKCGNLYFLLTIMNNHIIFLKQQQSKVSGQSSISMKTLEQVHQDIIDQHEAIAEVLLENIDNPITYDTLPAALGLDIDEPEAENVE